MRQLQITPKGHLISVAVDHNLGILTSVENLSMFDMIYIYHHINPGDELQVQREFSENRLQLIEVTYKGFKLGHISKNTAPIIGRLLDRGIPVKVTVKALSKQKYMPLTGLDIEVKALVDVD